MSNIYSFSLLSIFNALTHFLKEEMQSTLIVLLRYLLVNPKFHTTLILLGWSKKKKYHHESHFVLILNSQQGKIRQPALHFALKNSKMKLWNHFAKNTGSP